jgi:3D (Asp-Asp-Asp) domain-containing protein
VHLGTRAALVGLLFGSSIGSIGAAATASRDAASERGEPGRPVWYARVAGTGGSGLVVRTGPGQNYPVQITLREGSRVRITEGPRFDAQLRDWYQVVYDRAGSSGWSSSEFLLVAETVGPELPERIGPMVAERIPVERFRPSGAVQVRHTLQARLTAYTNQPPGNGAHGYLTRSGTPVRWGVVAVDPQVIPLGTRLMIDGFDDIFVAEDTGGGVRGLHVDIYFPDYFSALQFGVQSRAVAILE